MQIIHIFDFLLSFFPWGYVKLAVLLLVFLYIIFAAVIVRQETLMSRVVYIPSFPILRFVVLAHFFASIALFFLTLISV